MTRPFRRPPQSDTSPLPETPYARARQEWDARMGSAVLSARTWRRIAFGAVGLGVLLALGLIAVALQQRTFVHVVEVSPEGQVMAVRAAEETWTPSEAQIAYFIGRFVKLTRSLPTDPIVLRDNWLEAYAFVTPQAANHLSDIARSEDPFGQLGAVGRIVHVRSIVAKSDATWQVQWSEETTGAAGAPESVPMTGLFSVRHAPPRRAADIAVNPLGLFITSFSWSPDR